MTTPLPAQNSRESSDVLRDLPPSLDNLTQEQTIELLERLPKITQEMEVTNSRFARLQKSMSALQRENANLRQTASEVAILRHKMARLKEENERLKSKQSRNAVGAQLPQPLVS